MEAKFTPGPWQESHPVDRAKCNWQSIKAGGIHIADIANVDLSQNDANASLIAAAPEMYEILEEVLSELKEHTPDRHLYSQKLIESVLKKARGE